MYLKILIFRFPKPLILFKSRELVQRNVISRKCHCFVDTAFAGSLSFLVDENFPGQRDGTCEVSWLQNKMVFGKWRQWNPRKIALRSKLKTCWHNEINELPLFSNLVEYKQRFCILPPMWQIFLVVDSSHGILNHNKRDKFHPSRERWLNQDGIKGERNYVSIEKQNFCRCGRSMNNKSLAKWIGKSQDISGSFNLCLKLA